MYCYRCGKKLTGRESTCPDCDTPQKKRQGKQKRMVLGLFIFLAGALVGSFFDSFFFKGEVWKHSFFSKLFPQKNNDIPQNQQTGLSPNVEVKMQYNPSNTSPNVTNNEISRNDTSNLPSKIDSSKYESNEAKTEDYSNQISSQEIVNKPVDSIPTSEMANYQNEEVLPINQEEIASDNTAVNNNQNSNDLQYEEVLNPDDSQQEIIEDDTQNQLPQGNLVYRDITLLEKSARNSYHGFMARDGKELIFASDRNNVNGKPTFQCFTKNIQVEKSNSTRLFKWNGNIWTPEITPDSNMVVFSSDSSLPEHIFLYDRKSKESMALTSGKSKNMMPCISPDGKKIAFVSSRGDGKNRIYVMELLNSKKVTQITKGNVDDREPRWTPDGKSIIFTRIVEKMKNSKIMKVDVDPLSEPIALVDNKARNWMADISPDGTLLTYTRSLSGDGSKNVIVLYNLQTGKEEVMNFSGITDSFRPVWNSDGSGFVFHVNTKNGKAIYQANFDRE